MRPQTVEPVSSDKSPAERADSVRRARAMASALQARNGEGGQSPRAVAPVDESPKARPPEFHASESRADPAEKGHPVSREDMEKKVAALRELVPKGRQLSVTFELSTDEPPVLILKDSESGEEVRRIPRDKVALMTDSVDELRGLIVDSKA